MSDKLYYFTKKGSNPTSSFSLYEHLYKSSSKSSTSNSCLGTIIKYRDANYYFLHNICGIKKYKGSKIDETGSIEEWNERFRNFLKEKSGGMPWLVYVAAHQQALSYFESIGFERSKTFKNPNSGNKVYLLKLTFN